MQVIFYIIFSIFWASSSHCVNPHSVFPPWELNLNSVGTVYCTPGVESSITIYLLTLLTKCHLSPQEKAQNITVKLLYWSVAGCCRFHNWQPQTSDKTLTLNVSVSSLSIFQFNGLHTMQCTVAHAMDLKMTTFLKNSFPVWEKLPCKI